MSGDESARLEDELLRMVLANPVAATVLGRAPSLGLPQWQLTAGAVFQSVWNGLTGRDPQHGVRDHDLFYFDAADTSYTAEDAVIRAVADLFADVDAEVEVRNEARVHLWYERHFGVPATPFTSTRDAIDHFAATTCAVGVTRSAEGDLEVYAPFGLDDLFSMTLRPNPVLAPREVYEAKASAWTRYWPELTVLPWPEPALP